MTALLADKGLDKTNKLFKNQSLLDEHYGKHGQEIADVLGDSNYSIDKYLDDAYLSHLPSVRIVHGKGTGALRNAVQQHLKKCKYISEFHIAEYGEGDAGVTIATFKK